MATWIQLHILLTLTYTNVVSAISTESQCSTLHTKEPRRDYRCVSQTDSYTNMIILSRILCTYYCITRKDCVFMNFNVLYGYCLLSTEPCQDYVPDEEFVVTNLGPEPPCLKWVPHTQYNTSNIVPMIPCASDSSYRVCAVGRLGTIHWLPGKYHVLMKHMVSVLDGNTVTTGEKEILDVEDGCRVVWVPYIAGDTLQLKAVMGGYITGRGSDDTDLYLIRTTVNGFIIGGYYNPKTNRGHYEYFGAHELTQMEMLVLRWNANIVLNRCTTAITTGKSLSESVLIRMLHISSTAVYGL